MEKSILQLCKELENLGEDQVRTRLAEQFYSDAEEEIVAREWLKQKALARVAELERRKTERETVIARRIARAMTAAEETADGVKRTTQTATKSNEKASIAIMFAATAIIISALSLLAHLF